jgi:hypothetical protein
MDLDELKRTIVEKFTGSSENLSQILKLVENDEAIYPFNEYEHLICNLINSGGFSYENYLEIRSDYIAQNPNLWVFEISAPRGFGEKFAQTYVKGLCNELKAASKKFDPSYSGEYDLWLPNDGGGVRIEVKASRAVRSDIEAPLYERALSRDSTHPFLMNFQQLKPQFCDVFVWVAVFRDIIVVWVISSRTVENSKLYSSGQHRGNKGNEGQMHIRNDNIDWMKDHELKPNESLKNAILRVAGKQRGAGNQKSD